MVCCLCVDGNSAAILSSGHLRQSRDVGGILGSSLVGASQKPSGMQGRMFFPPAIGYGVSPGLQLSAGLLSEDDGGFLVGYNTLTNSDWVWIHSCLFVFKYILEGPCSRRCDVTICACSLAWRGSGSKGDTPAKVPETTA